MGTTDIDRDTGMPDAGADGPDQAAEGGRIRRTAGDAYETARQRGTALYQSARDQAARAGRRTAEGIDANPLAAVAGGLAFGVILAALLPATRRESQLLGGFGGRINDTARTAVRAARDAGRDKLDELGLSREGARQKLNDLASTASDAIRRSATAAAGSVRKPR